jgi:hypothetical protein
VAKVSWLEASRRALGIRLGTAASLAGSQISVMLSITKMAMAAHPTVTAASSEKSPTVGIEAKSRKRSRSQTTIV